MTREAKIGLLMVAVLVGVFGFLVYKRMHRPIEALADQRGFRDAEVVAEEEDAPKQSDDDLFSRPRSQLSSQNSLQAPPRQIEEEVLTFARREPSGIMREVEVVANKVEEFADEAIEDVKSLGRDKRRHDKPRIPDEFTADDDDASLFNRPRETNQRAQELQPPEPQENTFDDVPGQLAPPRVLADNNDRPTSDPFGDDSSGSKARPIEFKKERPAVSKKEKHARKTIRQVSADPFADDVADEQPSSRESQVIQSPAAQESVEVDTQMEEPRFTSDADNATELAPRERRRAAPMTLSDNDSPTSSTFPAADALDGSSYTIQPNDSFWSISRKRYGAGRYYMALALHNSQTIPDPKRMKPGVVISTPDISVLERRYAESIPKAAPVDSPQSVNTTQSRRSAEVEQSGYFVTVEGSPMYRVGEQDTLTDIAKTHLGRTSRWVQILEMNRNVLRDGNELKVGTVLRLPADASRVRIAGATRDIR